MNALHRRLRRAMQVALLGATALASATGFLRPQTPPTQRDAEALIEAFDRAFNARDLATIDHIAAGMYPSSRTSLRERLARAFAGAATLHRKTKLVDSTVRASYRIAQVQASTRCDVQQQSSTEVLILVLAAAEPTSRGSDSAFDSALPRLVLAVAADLAHLPGCNPAIGSRGAGNDGAFAAQCPPCNYRFEADAQWLLVPEPAVTAGSYEALTCWSLERDVAVTLSLHLARHAEAADTVLRSVLGTGGSHAATTIEPWLPPALAALPSKTVGGEPVAFGGAHASLPVDAAGRETELCFVAHGRVGYLFTCRGAAADLTALRPAIDRLGGGFQLLDPSRDPDSIAAAIEAHHFSATVEGGAFHDHASGVRFDAPSGFLARLAGGSARFDAAWCCPLENPTFRLRGLAPPAGMDRWSRAAVERLLESSFARFGLKSEIVLAWAGPRDGFDQLWQAQLRNGDGKIVRLVRVGLLPDLCVVLEADTTLALDATAAATAIGKLRRER